MKNNIKIDVAVMALALGFTIGTYAEESVVEKVETSKNKAVDSVKKTYRKMDDKLCETVNGKTKCVTKKIKNGIKNNSDTIKTEGKEIENKID